MLRNDVTALATAGSRMVGTRGHNIARDHIVDRLQQPGIHPYFGDSLELPYVLNGETFVNVVGRIPGRNSNLPPILIGAHYDTCGPYPGADDNAAAVAVILTAAAKLKALQLDRTMVLAFFDAEEPPYFLGPSMESIRFYQDQRMEEIHSAIIMDLVGHDVPVPGLEDLLFMTGMESDPALESVVRGAEPGSGIRTVPILNSYVGDMSDHHVFRTNRRPYLFLTCGRWEHYHSATDTEEKLNYAKIASISEYLIKLTAMVCAATLDGPFESHDTTETELFFLRNNIQPALEQLGLGISFNTRQDINRSVDILMSKFNL